MGKAVWSAWAATTEVRCRSRCQAVAAGLYCLEEMVFLGLRKVVQGPRIASEEEGQTERTVMEVRGGC